MSSRKQGPIVLWRAQCNQWFSIIQDINWNGAIGSRAGIDKNKCKLHALTLRNYDYDVEKMVNDFTSTLAQIESKGETFMEQLMCLFKVFETLHDQIFKNYIQSMKDKWEDGENIEWTNLIDQASEKYKSLCKAGIWKNKDSSKQSIIALTPMIEKTLRFSSAMKTPHPNKEKYQLKPCPEYQKEKGWEGVKPGYAEWKTTLPKSGEPHKKIVNNMTYHKPGFGPHTRLQIAQWTERSQLLRTSSTRNKLTQQKQHMTWVTSSQMQDLPLPSLLSKK